MAETPQFVTKDMIMGDIIRKYPSSMYALMACGLGCVGCPSAQGETLEQAAMVHGLNLDDVLINVNQWILEKEDLKA
ncbi:MAG: DUF1858 domain-containing protein [Clostridia bacterium]|nr:DUF1858 domain-containing protein [Clostridia bacterium]